jgi:hypothetical protein
MQKSKNLPSGEIRGMRTLRPVCAADRTVSGVPPLIRVEVVADPHQVGFDFGVALGGQDAAIGPENRRTGVIEIAPVRRPRGVGSHARLLRPARHHLRRVGRDAVVGQVAVPIRAGARVGAGQMVELVDRAGGIHRNSAAGMQRGEAERGSQLLHAALLGTQGGVAERLAPHADEH